MPEEFACPVELRKVIRDANREAYALGHEYIGTEHLLLGLLAQKRSTSLDILGDCGITPEMLRSDVLKMVPVNPPSQSPIHKSRKTLPLTPRAKKVINLAKDYASSIEEQVIKEEYLLHALVRENEGVAAQAILNHNLSLNRLEDRIELYTPEKAVRNIDFLLETLRQNSFKVQNRGAVYFIHGRESYDHLHIGTYCPPDRVIIQYAINGNAMANLEQISEALALRGVLSSSLIPYVEHPPARNVREILHSKSLRLAQLANLAKD